MATRTVRRSSLAKPTLEGAGVHLRRAFGFGETEDHDPFLLLDDFSGDRPEDYGAGFPWHPHRGIETITYLLAGSVEHSDSLGNRGLIGPGDVQWMTAGSGIVHQEMPKGDARGRLQGFQLWANLPRSLKMTPPRYRGLTAAEIPVARDEDGTEARVVSGRLWGTEGPVRGIAIDPLFLDVSVPPGLGRTLPLEAEHHAFAYVFAGSGSLGGAPAGPGSLVLLDGGDEVAVAAGEQGVRFLLVAGRPLGEPVAWRGPIVMNTPEELRQAFAELEQGTFLRDR